MRGMGRRLPRRDERGAVAALMAPAMVVVIMMAAYAVDLGMQRSARIDMQTVSDAVALDLSRLLDGRTTTEVKNGLTTPTKVIAPLATALDRSVTRNGGSALGSTPADCAAATGGTLSTMKATCVRAFLVTVRADGSYETAADGTPRETASNGVPNGVVVISRTRVPFAFANVAGFRSGDATRTALATNQKSACFKLGSITAAINSGDSSILGPLNTLLGLKLSLVDYRNLAGADLSIASLVRTGLLGGSPEEVLNGTFTLGTVYQATIRALAAEGDDASASTQGQIRNDNQVASLVLQQAAQAGVNLNQPVNLGSLNIDPTDTAGLNTQISLPDLLTGTLVLANGDSAVSIPNLEAGPAAVGTIQSTLRVVERIRLACGTVDTAPTIDQCESSTSTPRPRGCARNSQVTGRVTIPLTLPTVNQFVTVGARSVLDVELGNAVGVLTLPEPRCASGTASDPDELSVRTRTSAATTVLTTEAHFKRVIEVPVPAVPGVPGTPEVVVAGVITVPAVPGIPGIPASTVRVVVEFDARNTARVPSSPATKDNRLRVPPNDKTPVSGNSRAALGNPTTTTTSNVRVRIDNDGDGVGDVAVAVAGPVVEAAVNLVVNPLVSATTDQVASVTLPTITGPLVNTLNNRLINPLASILGLDVAGADVFAQGRPTCQTPRLSG